MVTKDFLAVFDASGQFIPRVPDEAPCRCDPWHRDDEKDRCTHGASGNSHHFTPPALRVSSRDPRMIGKGGHRPTPEKRQNGQGIAPQPVRLTNTTGTRKASSHAAFGARRRRSSSIVACALAACHAGGRGFESRRSRLTVVPATAGFSRSRGPRDTPRTCPTSALNVRRKDAGALQRLENAKRQICTLDARSPTTTCSRSRASPAGTSGSCPTSLRPRVR